MENRFIPIEDGLPISGVLCAIMLRDTSMPLPKSLHLAFFDQGEFNQIGESASIFPVEFVSFYHYIMDKDGSHVKIK